jgi:hypothetical protein
VRFRVLCPTLMPRSGAGVTHATAADMPTGDTGIKPTTSVVVVPERHRWLFVGGTYGAGETDPQNWSLNNPNYFFHFFVAEGHPSGRELELVGQNPQKLVGRRHLGGHDGALYAQVSYAICGCGFGGHVTFIWTDDGATYAASLHRWSARPNRSELAILGVLISRLKPV